MPDEAANRARLSAQQRQNPQLHLGRSAEEIRD